MGIAYIVILWFLFIFTISVDGGCPDASSILPCTCDYNNEHKAVLNCEKIEYDEELVSALIPAKKRKIFMVQLKDVSFMFFPEDLFTETKVKVIRIQDSSIFSLGESNLAFTGLEERLTALEVSNCVFVNNWDLSELSGMNKLRYLRISESELLEIPKLDIAHLPIEDLNFRDNLISEIPYRAFANFTQMKRITLDSNGIIGIMRSMLPVPATNLETIGLSHNKIQWLPPNAFYQMPALKYLYLGGNPLKTLQEKVFKPVWSQLQVALFQDCPLICNCYLAWITTAKQGQVALVSGRCDSPENLKGKRINELTPAYFQSC